MEIKNILVPTDGSEYTEEALEMAIGLAKLTGAKVTTLSVVDREAVMGGPLGVGTETITEILNREAQEAVAFVKEKCEAANIEVATQVLAGPPAEIIMEESGKYDLIVMSSLGKTGLSKFLIGSVAEKVIRTAKCPVLVIRHH